MLDDQVIIEQVQAFSRRASYERNNAVRRFSGQMADVNAVQGSAYMLGVALIEAQHIQSVDEYQAELNNQLLRDGVQSYIRMYTAELTSAVQIEIQNRQNNQQVLITAQQIMASMLQNKVQFQQAMTQMKAEIERIFMVAEAEYTGNEADIANRFAQWDFKVYNMATNVLGGMGGGQRLPEGTSKAGSAIGGALSGAASGAASGSGAERCDDSAREEGGPRGLR